MSTARPALTAKRHTKVSKTGSGRSAGMQSRVCVCLALVTGSHERLNSDSVLVPVRPRWQFKTPVSTGMPTWTSGKTQVAFLALFHSRHRSTAYWDVCKVWRMCVKASVSMSDQRNWWKTSDPRSIPKGHLKVFPHSALGEHMWKCFYKCEEFNNKTLQIRILYVCGSMGLGSSVRVLEREVAEYQIRTSRLLRSY